jgi:hypothetical protein
MTMQWLQGTGTIGAGNLGYIDFNNLPSEYSHLQIRYSVRDTGAFTTRGMFMEFNFSGTGYNEHYLKGNGSSASSQSYTGLTRFDWGELPAASATANTFGVGIVDIYDFNSTTKNKTVKVFHGYDLNGSGEINLWSGVWKNNAAITNIRLYTNNAFVQNSRLDLYGFRTSTSMGG